MTTGKKVAEGKKLTTSSLIRVELEESENIFKSEKKTHGRLSAAPVGCFCCCAA